MSESLRKIRHGVGWGGLSVTANFLFQMLFMAIMARLLNPADFGLMALAMVSIRFLSYFSQIGIVPAIIQKPSITDGDLAAALSVSILISSICALVLALSAPLIAGFYEISGLIPVIRILSLGFIINGLASISIGILRKEMRFKEISVIETLSYLIAYGVVGLAMAFSGNGVWSLVFASLVQSAAMLVMSYSITRHSMRIRHTESERKHFLSFGSRYSVIGFLEFLTANLDSVFIGKLLGAGPAGIYNRALLMANLPVEKPANVISKSLFPILSSVTGEREKLLFGYQLSTILVGVFAFSVGVGISVSADYVVLSVLGDKWADAIPVLQILALSVGPIFTSHIACVTLDSMGVLNPKIFIQSVCIVLLLGLFFLFRPMGLVGFASAVLITELLRMAAYFHLMKSSLKIPGSQILRTILIILVVAASVAIAAYAWRKLLVGADINPWYGLIYSILICGFGLIMSAVLVRRNLVSLDSIQWLITKNYLVGKILRARLWI